MSDYKEQCWKRYMENKKYERYDKEDLVDEIIDLQGTIESNTNSYNKLSKYSNELEERINKAIEYIEEAYKEDEINVGNIYHEAYRDIEKILKGE